MSRRTVPLSSTRPVTPTRVASRLRAVAFWSSVLLPIAYVPLLYGGVGGQVTAFLGLIALNVACLIVGHEYTP